MASKPNAWLSLELKPKSLGIDELIKTLEKNDLKFGYGDYWSSEVNSIYVLTKGKILVAPIRPKEKNYFLIVPNFQTPEWSLSKEESIKLATIYFGNPVKIIPLSKWTVIVWDHPLSLSKMSEKIFSTLYSSSYKFLQDGNSLDDLYPKYLEEHGYLDKSFGYNEGEAINWTKNGGWIGKWGCPDGKGRCFGVGLMGDIDLLRPIIDEYKDKALQIYFPYPKIYDKNSKDKNGELLMIFRAP